MSPLGFVWGRREEGGEKGRGGEEGGARARLVLLLYSSARFEASYNLADVTSAYTSLICPPAGV